VAAETESLDYDETAELSVEWREEILRRCEEIADGLVELEDADKVFARLRGSDASTPATSFIGKSEFSD
jgi:hypothetical protein